MDYYGGGGVHPQLEAHSLGFFIIVHFIIFTLILKNFIVHVKTDLLNSVSCFDINL